MNEKSKRPGASVATLLLATTLALLSAPLVVGTSGCASPKPEPPLIIHASDLFPSAPGAVFTNPAPAGVKRYWSVSDRAWPILLRVPQPKETDR